MSSYELEKRITSCFVDVTLLQEIEKYILNQGESQRKDDSRVKYNATIYDKFGEEQINLFENFPRSTLPNEAKRIRLDLHDYETDFRISVSFSREHFFSRITINVVGNSAREKAIGILNSIESRLAEHKNLNFIFHSWVPYSMFAPVGMSIGWIIPILVGKKIDVFSLVGSFLLIIIAIYFSLKIVNPYSVFDTNRNRQIRSFVKWILNGLAGVFLFGLLASAVRKYIVGF
jgi:hypothetical protein